MARTISGKICSRVSSPTIINTVATNTGVDRRDVELVYREALDAIRKLLLDGARVNLSRLGTLEGITRAERKYRHPQTGRIQQLPERKSVRFILSRTLKEKLK